MRYIYFLLILMIVFWSLSFIIVDIAVETISPITLAFYRFLVASISFLIIDLYRIIKNKGKFKTKDEYERNSRFSKNEWVLIIFGSFTGVSIFFFVQYSAIKMIGPSLPALFVCLLAPIIISILSLIFFKEKLNSLKITGFIIASFGGFLLITGGDLKTLSPESPNFIGYMFALLTPFLWAFYTIITKKIVKKKQNSEMRMLKYIAYFGTIELFVFVLLTNEVSIFINSFLNFIIIICALYLGIGCYIFGYFVWQKSQNKLNSSKVASFLYIEPFITLIVSFLLQRKEAIVLWNIIGGIIILIAVLIINYK